MDLEYIDRFKKFKDILTTGPVLKYSNFELGAVLGQKGHPAYISRTLNEHERKYVTIDKDAWNNLDSKLCDVTSRMIVPKGRICPL